ncbi:sprouty-related, EVH1 domain-containing protein 2-like isoform X2 [Mytilus galloprovincialis]|uniref:Sprouty-related, EVH1 domain-containing protein n=1 Tax=Mytilus galloprovincialis TaxID=29158 RepID=A0A8B6CHD8_MYTGA|nr:sprouty-related, EVH1 domain-containing protein [Mytilus galloprovincialis]
MTEDIKQNEDFLVQVQAQVMTRDDSSGGWVPMGGGGLSNVGLRRLSRPSNNGEETPLTEYLIYGERIVDKSVVLDCVLKRDMKYFRPNPKFHHWITDDKRFGLTFQRSDDAKAFNKGIKIAVADLTDGNSNLSNLDGDEEVFAILDLPIPRRDSSSQSASTTSTTTSSPTPQSPSSLVSGMPDPFTYTHSHANHHHLHRVHYITSPHRSSARSPPSDSSKSDNLEKDEIYIKSDEPTSVGSKSDQGLLENDNVETKEYSYVIIAKKDQHEYSYPTLESVQKPVSKREAMHKCQTSLPHQHPPLPKKKQKDKHRTHLLQNQKSRCKYCRELFSHDDNARGSCEDAPDGVEKCIEYVTCVWCAKGIIYHCMADPDGDYGHPCVCDTSDRTNCKKWTALTILSLFLPCLWCYWPCMACHKCGVSCGCCGGRHKAS